MNKPISYSAPAKVILSGEHAVVYGKPALITAIDMRLAVTITPAQKTAHIDPQMAKIVNTVVQFLKQQKKEYIQKPFSYGITSSIPAGRGLGSSAALSAAFSGALLEHFTGHEWSREEVNNCAYQVEKIFHGNPSGADVSTSVFGGLIYFRKEFEFLKTISSLTLKIPQVIGDNLFVIDTGKPLETTGEMVAGVGKKYNKNPLKVEKLLNEIEKTTKRLVVALAKEDSSLFQDTIRANHQLLCDIGVVSKQTKKIIDDLEQIGVGKVTGGGGKKEGSGFILFYAAHHKQLHEYGKKNKLDIIKLQPTTIGLRKEN